MSITTRPQDAIGLPGLSSMRIMRGLSRSDIADCMGLSYHTVYAWETGKNSPSLRNMLKLCRLFHVTPNDLLGFSDGPVWMQQADALIAAHLH